MIIEVNESTSKAVVFKNLNAYLYAHKEEVDAWVKIGKHQELK